MRLFAFTFVLCYAFAQEDYNADERLLTFEAEMLDKILNMAEKVQTENKEIKTRTDAIDCESRIAKLEETKATTYQELKEQLATLLRLKESIHEAETSNATMTKELQNYHWLIRKLKLELQLLDEKLVDMKSWRENGWAEECFRSFNISEDLIEPRAGKSSSLYDTTLNMNREGNVTAMIEMFRQMVPEENNKLIGATIEQTSLAKYERIMKQDCEDRIKSLDEEIKKALVDENTAAISIQQAEATLKHLNDVIKKLVDEVEMQNGTVESLTKEIIEVREDLSMYSKDEKCYDLLQNYRPE